MAAKDLIHEAVVNALIKDGWKIKDTLYISVPGTSVKVDLGAEKVLFADRGKTRIAVEIKSFTADSMIQSFAEALGKFRLYLHAIHQSPTENDRRLYVATSMQGYYRLSNVEFIKDTIDIEKIPLIIVDINKEVIKQWRD